jgi:dUTP pyrophosphatase
MIMKYKKLNPDAKTPIKKISVDAGFDLTAIWKEVTPKYIAYGTGIAVEIPVGYVGLAFPRSSVTTYDLMLKNCVGVIDASYRGEIRCRFTPVVNNNILDIIIAGDTPIEFMYNEEKQYEVGERICQIVFLELPKITLNEVQELSDTVRGAQGFGHSGK